MTIRTTEAASQQNGFIPRMLAELAHQLEVEKTETRRKRVSHQVQRISRAVVAGTGIGHTLQRRAVPCIAPLMVAWRWQHPPAHLRKPSGVHGQLSRQEEGICLPPIRMHSL